MITIKNVDKVFHTKQGSNTAVEGVNLNITEGEIFGVIGYSGAGKSTLIRMLNGLETPTAGTIHIAGRELSNSSGAELRKARQDIGMIFQHFNLLWSRTVHDNIAFPLEIAGVSRMERKEKVEELIKLVGLEGRSKAYPSQLSGGQKQRVGIARALANNPNALLCDEATSALDPETTDAILDLLVDINKRFGITIVLITHEMHVIRKICHRVAVMEAGKIVELGDVFEVFGNPQKEITKKFVQQLTNGLDEEEETIEMLSDKYSEGKVIRLHFIGNQASEPVITELIKNYNLLVTILHGNISHTQKGAIGTLFVHIEGGVGEINNALQFLKSQHIRFEVMKNDE